MTRNDVLKLFPDATDEQITNLLNKSGEEMAREKEKANQYKAKADKADELQAQLDELQAGNMTELEKANKALETANQQIAKLQKDNAVRDLRESAMSDFGITAEQAKTINKPQQREVANCIKARYDCGISNLRSDGNLVVKGYGRDGRQTD